MGAHLAMFRVHIGRRGVGQGRVPGQEGGVQDEAVEGSNLLDFSVQYSTWYNAVRETVQKLLQYNTRYNTVPFTSQSLVQYSLWYNAVYGTI